MYSWRSFVFRIWLYRKVVLELAEKGYKGVTLDLLGLGLSDRAQDFEYTWSGIVGAWLCEATVALKLDKFHLIVHAVGGPVDMELVAKHPEQIYASPFSIP